ncbi:conserved hypothetical protein [Histoplasma capsulatum H143]|uniref:Uncharacterized protein n=1 Tax=Ajellomyces capsulatus (strain H143) TaxID=544712 RepID=C6HJS0_AJECH|nr:conserved hypothetical protein [Histoplasma capsulatum H143]
MGRVEPPFMYDPPSSNRFSGISDKFDPKSVTRESWTPREPRMEIKGPLVNFNTHPDSYIVIPDGKFNKKTMSPKTKHRVKYTRTFQLVLRVCTLIGGLGLLFCVICINKTAGVVSWMIRVAPGVTILHTIYAIYHLSRSSAARTPASSASYMLFASVMDAGLIPLYVFTGIIARVEQTSKIYGWGTLFDTELAANKIEYAVFLGCSITAGLHLASLVISIYLAVVFRKISKLPPDMNPLEDNLTSRPHKRTKFNIAEVATKHMSDSTIDSSGFNRGSLSYRYSRSDLPSQQARQHEQLQHTPVGITRTTARDRVGGLSRPQSAIINTPPKRESLRPEAPETPSRNPSDVSSLSKENWFAYPSSPSPPPHTDRVSPLPDHPGLPDMSGKDIGVKHWEGTTDLYGFGRSNTVIRHRSQDNYSPLSSYSDDDHNIYDKEHTENLYVYEQDLSDKGGSNAYDDDKTPSPTINPLKMNPPTPQPSVQQQLNSYGQTGNAVNNSTPGKKRWTLRGGKPSAYESLQPDDDSDDGRDASPAHLDSDRKGRVVSNSGIDLGSGFGSGSPGYGSYLAGLGVGRRRDVSGKAAEEGRIAGVRMVAEEEEREGAKPKGRRLSKSGGGEIRAAGWARFKGL